MSAVDLMVPHLVAKLALGDSDVVYLTLLGDSASGVGKEHHASGQSIMWVGLDGFSENQSR
ncbi:hypothetical protein RchiOBHm_Chr1g0349681 [Rosa chinensis]|uniref:Uncharacterized protein n=1 Tax=Rosa chinensis TaxID=74649 RepID=A0A2P6SFV0_ROSCH|nr:hypothetical protein RchiOBHm_Chr1g0349681 [Rosa chinensis]